MTKPIGYYISNVSDAAALEQIAKLYGDRLEKLDRAQKLETVMSIADSIWDRHGKTEISGDLRARIEKLSDEALLGLMTATVEQLRHESLAPEGWRSVIS